MGRKHKRPLRSTSGALTALSDTTDGDDNDPDMPVHTLPAPPPSVAQENGDAHVSGINGATVVPTTAPTQGNDPRDALRQKLRMLRAARTRGTGASTTRSSSAAAASGGGGDPKTTKKLAQQYKQDPDEMLRSIGVDDPQTRLILKHAMDSGDITDIKKIAASIAAQAQDAFPT